MKRWTLIAASLLLVTVALPGAASAQQTPSHLADLLGVSARSGDGAMHERGYVHIDTQKWSDASYSHWWSANRRDCVTVATRNGRFDGITEAPPADCNQTAVSSGGDDAAVGAAIALGAAALIGAIASSQHKSHHHDDGAHTSDAFSESEFERGHSDGLYNHSFDDYNNTAAYREGYDSGVEQRHHNTSYRVHSGRNERGYQPAHEAARFESLANTSLQGANEKLRDWGFQDREHFGDNTTRYAIWYNRSTGQCVQQTVDARTRRTVDVRDIGYHAACR